MSHLRQKVLLLLLAGIAFGFSYTPGRQWKIIKGVSREWKKIDQKELVGEIKKLYESKFIEKKRNIDGSTTIILTDNK